jgi:hypothetical protein
VSGGFPTSIRPTDAAFAVDERPAAVGPSDQLVMRAGREGETWGCETRCRPNDPTVHPQDASTRLRTGGAPLAATNAKSGGSDLQAA